MSVVGARRRAGKSSFQIQVVYLVTCSCAFLGLLQPGVYRTDVRFGRPSSTSALSVASKMTVTSRQQQKSRWPSTLRDEPSSSTFASKDSRLPQDDSHPASRTINYAQSLRLLPWQTDNQFVLSGYRRQRYSIKACLWSSISRSCLLFSPTNKLRSFVSIQMYTMRLVRTLSNLVICEVLIKLVS